MHTNSATYGPALATLLAGAPCNDLGPGKADASRQAALADLTPESVAAPHRLRSREMALACIAGLWLRYDFLDQSHRISQHLAGPTGSFWHAVMHRRERDFDNAKYWFQRVGDHPIFGPLNSAVQDLARQSQAPVANYLATQDAWDAMWFLNLCQSATRSAPALRDCCMQIQQREWELLFEHCYRQTIGEIRKR